MNKIKTKATFNCNVLKKIIKNKRLRFGEVQEYIDLGQVITLLKDHGN